MKTFFKKISLFSSRTFYTENYYSFAILPTICFVKENTIQFKKIQEINYSLIFSWFNFYLEITYTK